MPSPDCDEPVADDELLYRRIPASTGWYSEGVLSPMAFRPHPERDIDGISLWCARRYTSIEEAARGQPQKEYYVAILRAGDLKDHGIEVTATRERGEPGHISLPGLNSQNRHEPASLDLQGLLAGRLTLRVEGPFRTPSPD
jgi:hypothetical protein